LNVSAAPSGPSAGKVSVSSSSSPLPSPSSTSKPVPPSPSRLSSPSSVSLPRAQSCTQVIFRLLAEVALENHLCDPAAPVTLSVWFDNSPCVYVFFSFNQTDHVKVPFDNAEFRSYAHRSLTHAPSKKWLTAKFSKTCPHFMAFCSAKGLTIP